MDPRLASMLMTVQGLEATLDSSTTAEVVVLDAVEGNIALWDNPTAEGHGKLDETEVDANIIELGVDFEEFCNSISLEANNGNFPLLPLTQLLFGLGHPNNHNFQLFFLFLSFSTSFSFFCRIRITIDFLLS